MTQSRFRAEAVPTQGTIEPDPISLAQRILGSLFPFAQQDGRDLSPFNVFNDPRGMAEALTKGDASAGVPEPFDLGKVLAPSPKAAAPQTQERAEAPRRQPQRTTATRAPRKPTPPAPDFEEILGGVQSRRDSATGSAEESGPLREALKALRDIQLQKPERTTGERLLEILSGAARGALAQQDRVGIAQVAGGLAGAAEGELEGRRSFEQEQQAFKQLELERRSAVFQAESAIAREKNLRERVAQEVHSSDMAQAIQILQIDENARQQALNRMTSQESVSTVLSMVRLNKMLNPSGQRIVDVPGFTKQQLDMFPGADRPVAAALARIRDGLTNKTRGLWHDALERAAQSHPQIGKRYFDGIVTESERDIFEEIAGRDIVKALLTEPELLREINDEFSPSQPTLFIPGALSGQ